MALEFLKSTPHSSGRGDYVGLRPSAKGTQTSTRTKYDLYISLSPDSIKMLGDVNRVALALDGATQEVVVVSDPGGLKLTRVKSAIPRKALTTLVTGRTHLLKSEKVCEVSIIPSADTIDGRAAVRLHAPAVFKDKGTPHGTSVSDQ